MIFWLVGAVALYFLNKPKGANQVAGVMGGVPVPTGGYTGAGIPNGQGYTQNTATFFDPGVPFSISGPRAAPFATPGNVPVRPTGDPGVNARSVVAQTKAVFGLKISPTFQGRGNF